MQVAYFDVQNLLELHFLHSCYTWTVLLSAHQNGDIFFMRVSYFSADVVAAYKNTVEVVLCIAVGFR